MQHGDNGGKGLCGDGGKDNTDVHGLEESWPEWFDLKTVQDPFELLRNPLAQRISTSATVSRLRSTQLLDPRTRTRAPS